MFYVYVLKISKGGQIYIGYTSDLRRRIKEHMSLQSGYTKHRLPVGLIYYEAFVSEKDARAREQNLKQFKGSYGQLKKRIQNSLQAFELQ
jgi:putative endonuclease